MFTSFGHENKLTSLYQKILPKRSISSIGWNPELLRISPFYWKVIQLHFCWKYIHIIWQWNCTIENHSSFPNQNGRCFVNQSATVCHLTFYFNAGTQIFSEFHLFIEKLFKCIFCWKYIHILWQWNCTI